MINENTSKKKRKEIMLIYLKIFSKLQEIKNNNCYNITF